jgi:uncharacterized protein (DUF58 family)
VNVVNALTVSDRHTTTMITTAGRTVGVIAVAFVAAGIGWEFPAFIVPGAGLGAALLLAAVATRRLPAMSVDIGLQPARVTRGEQVTLTLTARNTGTRRGAACVVDLANPFTAEDASPLSWVVPRLSPGDGGWRDEVECAAARRGVWPIGPACVRRSDRLGMAIRARELPGAPATMVVRPVVHRLEPPRSGRSRRTDSSTWHDIPMGSVTFDSVREYVPGDDTRRMHWLSLARTGKPFVRTYVDHGSVRGVVVLDTRRRAYGREAVDGGHLGRGMTPAPAGDTGSASGEFCQEFEDAVEVAASVVVALADCTIPVRLYAGPVPTRPRPGDVMGSGFLLDALAGARLADVDSGLGSPHGDELATAVGTAAAESLADRATRLIVVTGSRDAGQADMAAAVSSRFDRTLVVRVGYPDVGVHITGGVTVVYLPAAWAFPGIWPEISVGAHA